jgi:A/G-specific adenine glycosylase
MNDQYQFKKCIKDYYANNRRSFPWREQITPYRTVVSEIMLQQTQTDRVLQKFDPFIARFPDFTSLAQAHFQEVLGLWKGLGYNRRAIALHQTAQCITREHHGILPQIPETLESFPGIGPATARSIISFAFNIPTVFIETNIRTVFIHFFFSNHTVVSDKEILPLVAQTVDQTNPREWYYALMDYGVMLKKTVGNASRLSKHYHKQSPFQGSERQIRGKILHYLLEYKGGLSEAELITLLGRDETLVRKIVNDLKEERFIIYNNNRWHIR